MGIKRKQRHAPQYRFRQGLLYSIRFSFCLLTSLSKKFNSLTTVYTLIVKFTVMIGLTVIVGLTVILTITLHKYYLLKCTQRWKPQYLLHCYLLHYASLYFVVFLFQISSFLVQLWAFLVRLSIHSLVKNYHKP